MLIRLDFLSLYYFSQFTKFENNILFLKLQVFFYLLLKDCKKTF